MQERVNYICSCGRARFKRFCLTVLPFMHLALSVVAAAQFGPEQVVSKSAVGVLANSDSYRCSVTSEGRFIGFESKASNLLAVAANPNSYRQVFLLDRGANRVEELSVSSTPSELEADADSNGLALTSDGKFAVFDSSATNLVAGDAQGHTDVFFRDRANRTTERVSVNSRGEEGDGESQEPDLSSDGRFVVFKSYATNLVDNDFNRMPDVFLRDRANHQTVRVSQTSLGTEANYDSTAGSPAISADGRYVVFGTRATNLLATDANGVVSDVIRYDRTNGAIELVSTTPVSGAPFACDSSSAGPGSISADGRYIVFTNGCSPGGVEQVYLRDMSTSTAELISRDESGNFSNDDSGDFISGAKVSADGRWVAFSSRATNLTTSVGTGLRRLFVVDRQATPRITVIDRSADRFCFSSDGSTLVYRVSTPAPRLTYLVQRDQCPSDAAKVTPGICGCGVRDSDADADGVLDCLDQCPTDRFKNRAGSCGCNVIEDDSNADGVIDCVISSQLKVTLQQMDSNLKKLTRPRGSKQRSAMNRRITSLKSLSRRMLTLGRRGPELVGSGNFSDLLSRADGAVKKSFNLRDAKLGSYLRASRQRIRQAIARLP